MKLQIGKKITQNTSLTYEYNNVKDMIEDARFEGAHKPG